MWLHISRDFVFTVNVLCVESPFFQAILTGIEVEWIMHGFMNTKKKPEPPPSLITGEHMLSKLVPLINVLG